MITRSPLIWKNIENLSTGICLSANTHSSSVSINLMLGTYQEFRLHQLFCYTAPWPFPTHVVTLKYNYKSPPYRKVPCQLSEPYTASFVCLPKSLKDSRCILHIAFFDIIISFLDIKIAHSTCAVCGNISTG